MFAKFALRTAAISVLALGALTTGCNEVTLVAPPDTVPPTRVDAVVEVFSEDPENPLTVNFGEVNAGEFRDHVVTVRNIGTDTLQLQDLQLDHPSISIVNEDEVSLLLVPEAQTTVTLRYEPRQNETVETTLTVASNDRQTPTVPVRVLAEGLAPSLRLDPESFDFGNNQLGCVGQLEIDVMNVGRAPLTVTDIAFEDLAGNGEMALISAIDLSTGPLTIAPNDRVTVEVHYVPTDVEPDTGVLRVVSDDPAAPAEGKTATQFGIASLGESNVDQYTQDGSNSSDILWVVDNSGSMGDEQTSLASNFSSFIQIVEAVNLDYQIGVVSTDVADNGNLWGSTPIVTPSTPDPAGTFSSNVTIGTSGSASEKAFHCGWLAVDPSANRNPGFMRPEAGLRIIFVSDEAEQSSGMSFPSTIAYVQAFQSLKVNPDMVILSDITGGLAGCSGAGGSAGAGADFVTASTMTGGISASICDPNWVATLSALAWLAQSYADTFELSKTPVEDTIEVRLNGATIFVGWTYDPSLNAIIFDADAIPDNGDLIEIEYTVLGNCND